MMYYGLGPARLGEYYDARDLVGVGQEPTETAPAGTSLVVVAVLATVAALLVGELVLRKWVW
jgi:hypothetical protein